MQEDFIVSVEVDTVTGIQEIRIDPIADRISALEARVFQLETDLAAAKSEARETPRTEAGVEWSQPKGLFSGF